MNIPKIIFIVPYRDRLPQKTHFTVYMKYILEDLEKDSYEIYFSHQMDQRSFNRGAMKNIGFLAMKNKYPNHYKDITFVFNDIDTIPCIKNLINYETQKGIVKHFYGFKFALGGIFSIKGSDFEKCKGFPNFWGWGLEDNIINKRVINNNIYIDRSNFFPIGNMNILQATDRPIRLINDRETTSQLTSIEGYHHINQLKYSIEDNMINVHYFDTLYPFIVDEFYKRNIASGEGSNKTQKNVLKNWEDKPQNQYRIKNNHQKTQNSYYNNNNNKNNNINLFRMY